MINFKLPIWLQTIFVLLGVVALMAGIVFVIHSVHLTFGPVASGVCWIALFCLSFMSVLAGLVSLLSRDPHAFLVALGLQLAGGALVAAIVWAFGANASIVAILVLTFIGGLGIPIYGLLQQSAELNQSAASTSKDIDDDHIAFHRKEGIKAVADLEALLK